VLVDAPAEGGNPLDVPPEGDDVGVMLVRGLCQSIAHRVEDGRSRLDMILAAK
jgi:hypothetical protein